MIDEMEKKPSIFAFITYCIFSATLIIVPILWILFDKKSPLLSTNTDFIDGFGLGLGFLFFISFGLLLGFGVLSRFRKIIAEEKSELNKKTK